MSAAPHELAQSAGEDDDIEPSWLAPKMAALFAKPLFYQIVDIYDNPSTTSDAKAKWAKETLVRIMETVASADAMVEERVPYAIAELQRYAEEVHESKIAYERASKKFQTELELALGSRHPQLLRDLAPFSSRLDNFFEKGSPAQRWLLSATEELFGSGVFDVSSSVAIKKGSLERIGVRLEQMKEEEERQTMAAEAPFPFRRVLPESLHARQHCRAAVLEWNVEVGQELVLGHHGDQFIHMGIGVDVMQSNPNTEFSQGFCQRD